MVYWTALTGCPPNSACAFSAGQQGGGTLEADLYLDRMDLGRYWPADAGLPLQDFLAQMKSGNARPADYPFLTRRRFAAFQLVLSARDFLPSVPLVTVPQPTEPELVPLNAPDENALVLVTGNNTFTFQIMATIWAQGVTPAYFLMVDCLGNTVDMAMVFGTFTPEKFSEALKKSGLDTKVKHRHMIVPGWTSSLAGDLARISNWEVEVGPLCAAEFPLYLGDRWRFVEGLER